MKVCKPSSPWVQSLLSPPPVYSFPAPPLLNTQEERCLWCLFLLLCLSKLSGK